MSPVSITPQLFFSERGIGKTINIGRVWYINMLDGIVCGDCSVCTCLFQWQILHPFSFAVWEIGKTILKGDRGVMDTGLYRFCAYIYFFQVI